MGMLEQITTVATQVVILFVLIFVGFLCGKTRLFNDEVIAGLTSFTLYVVTPAAIVDSFCREFRPELLTDLLIILGAALFSHIAGIVLSSLIIRDKDIKRQRVLRIGAVFSNCGYMGLPLLGAVLGSIGIFYGAAYVIIFTLMSWTYGLAAVSGDRREISLKKLAVNPGIIGSAIGLIIFLFSVKLPDILYMPVHYLGALNTPVPMMIVGYQLSKLDLSGMWKKASYYVASFVRLILIPFVTFAVLYLLGMRGDLLVSCILSASMPSAALTTMFAVRYKQDTEAASSIVAMTTLLSLITLPLIIGLVRYVS
ncbi:MAG TPA: AEC family transporter [Feifaniaceae bacterium]|nr:AEC family transporter [Feifaniaceae bacterium]